MNSNLQKIQSSPSKAPVAYPTTRTFCTRRLWTAGLRMVPCKVHGGWKHPGMIGSQRCCTTCKELIHDLCLRKRVAHRPRRQNRSLVSRMNQLRGHAWGPPLPRDINEASSHFAPRAHAQQGGSALLAAEKAKCYSPCESAVPPIVRTTAAVRELFLLHSK